MKNRSLANWLCSGRRMYRTAIPLGGDRDRTTGDRLVSLARRCPAHDGMPENITGESVAERHGHAISVLKLEIRDAYVPIAVVHGRHIDVPTALLDRPDELGVSSIARIEKYRNRIAQNEVHRAIPLSRWIGKLVHEQPVVLSSGNGLLCYTDQPNGVVRFRS